VIKIPKQHSVCHSNCLLAHIPRFGIIDCTKVVKFGLLLSIIITIRVPGKMLDADTTNGNKKLQFKYDIHPKKSGTYCLNVYPEITQSRHNITVLCNMKFNDKE
jgi:hypothetical protein